MIGSDELTSECHHAASRSQFEKGCVTEADDGQFVMATRSKPKLHHQPEFRVI
jgi:hypothetical protein